MAKILFLGPQGSGKGTQGDLLAKELGIPRISTGDIMRREIEKGTEFGKTIASYIDRGNLLPDDMTNGIVEARLREKDCSKGFILDGFPRNLAQASLFDRTCQLDHAILIDISEKETLARLLGRRACECGTAYHLKFNPPRSRGVCDMCGRGLFCRKDDNEKAIRQRLKIYWKQTAPLEGFYRSRGVLRKIDGEQEIEKVFADIMVAIRE